ncbi:MAG: prmC [Ferruginibacter sp.]|nr:prmC [Ferruginibacter sp.]
MSAKAKYRDLQTQIGAFYPADEASAITAILFEWATGISRQQLNIFPDEEISLDAAWKIDEGLKKLQQHQPIQYVTGEAWFYRLKFRVSPAVLIPRPETEELVLEVLAELQNRSASTIIDIGTGSGCIGVAIKKNSISTNVAAIDISETALSMAKENADANEVTIGFQQVDFLDESARDKLPVYDIIVSNPPYIPQKEKLTMDEHVAAHEPALALFVPDNQPLVFYEAIAEFGQTHLAENGKVFLETHEDFAGAVAEHFNQRGYTALVKKDLFEKTRMVLATRCH